MEETKFDLLRKGHVYMGALLPPDGKEWLYVVPACSDKKRKQWKCWDRAELLQAISEHSVRRHMHLHKALHLLSHPPLRATNLAAHQRYKEADFTR